MFELSFDCFDKLSDNYKTLIYNGFCVFIEVDIEVDFEIVVKFYTILEVEFCG